ncbi:carboxypeptidase M32 [Alicyclobacillus tolerans]|uniref:carboxypeptidase M32 n=1 Tax=Alicyclobacillus tolerans TaxID=90970 RepID=UPI001F1C95E6|nr:carboxypeptidase M32 [Alicyclobacillus tolerans]MCF8564011.1 carboxypeptidase M32 [Alicyclobacillus tolerans]
MSTPIDDAAALFRAHVQKMLHYQEALALMYWDLRTGAPKRGVELRAEAIGTLSAELFKLETSRELEQYLNQLSEPSTYNQLDPITQKSVLEVKKQYDRNHKIPAERYQEFVVLTSQAESVWEDAKNSSNFELFKPYLEKIVAINQEFVDYWGYKEHKYDTLLDKYEPGMTVQQVDKIFSGLREETVKLVEAIVRSGQKPNVKPFLRAFDVAKQRQLSLALLERMGYDFSAGRLDETVHPFETTINRYDVRVTTKFLPDEMRSAIFSTIHEGGHALYEQGISPDLIGTPLADGASMGIHESQSRFWENMIGRSREFWEYNYKTVLDLFPMQFADVSVEDFYRGVNVVEPSLIRIEADEVTYNLHIMIRYEIEKGLIDGSLSVSDLPEIWRSKMQEYLGVAPENDADGVLQDVHWAGGDFGYFPTYALGNIYAAQFLNALKKDIPDYKEQVRRGNLRVIKNWLNQSIHRYGKTLMPAEIVRQVTGENIDSKYLIGYFREKFKPLYHLL